MKYFKDDYFKGAHSWKHKQSLAFLERYQDCKKLQRTAVVFKFSL